MLFLLIYNAKAFGREPGGDYNSFSECFVGENGGFVMMDLLYHAVPVTWGTGDLSVTGANTSKGMLLRLFQSSILILFLSQVNSFVVVMGRQFLVRTTKMPRSRSKLMTYGGTLFV